MELITKVAIIGIVGALIALLLKKSNPEMALLLALSIGMIVVSMMAGLISGIMRIVDMIESQAGLSHAAVLPVIKCVGIGIVTKFASQLCKDAGEGSVASAVEMAGAASALYIALPLIETLLEMIGGLL